MFNQRMPVYEGASVDKSEEAVRIPKPLYKKFPENTPAGRLQKRIPNVPINLLELIYMKKCTECGFTLMSINNSLAHYNSAKHQTKMAFLFMPNGFFNLPLSKEEISNIETGVSSDSGMKIKSGTIQMTIRELVKRFGITEELKKLDFANCRLCQCKFQSKISALRHYGSKGHKKKLETMPLYNPVGCYGQKNDLRCDLCNVMVAGDGVLEAHLSSKKHLKKMEAYSVAMAEGRIPAPMSSRGFYDFNNVEREEANPFDPSKFSAELVTPGYGGMQMGTRQDMGMGLRPDLGMGVRSDLGMGVRQDMAMRQEMAMGVRPDMGMGGFESGMYQGGYSGGLMGEFRQPGFGIMGQGVPMVPGGVQYGMMGDMSQGMNPSTWGGHQGMGVPGGLVPAGMYSQNIAHNKVSLKPPAQQFGPTKFQYTRKQPH